MVNAARRYGHAKADLQWKLALAVMAWQKRCSLPQKELPSRTAERFPRAHVLRDERAPMRDGVTLASDVYLPADEDGRPLPEAVPAVLVRMPYGIREPYAYMPAVARFWARRGYACVVQDVRGKFDSEGDWDPFVHEIEDGYDAVEWVSRRPWCDGRVGMTGESYYGYTQWAAAASGHPALTCISPGDMGVDIYAMVYQGGALALSTLALWACDQARRRYINFFRFDTRHLPLRTLADAAGLPSRLFDEVMAHPVRGELWERFDLSAALAVDRHPCPPLGRLVRQPAPRRPRLLAQARGGRTRGPSAGGAGAAPSRPRPDRPRDVDGLLTARGTHPAAGRRPLVGPRPGLLRPVPAGAGRR